MLLIIEVPNTPIQPQHSYKKQKNKTNRLQRN